MKPARMPVTAWMFPLLALVFYGAAGALGLGGRFTPSALGIVFAALLMPVLFGSVMAAVHHAEVIAHRTGEPYGTLILTVAVTVIEVALIASVMLADAAGGPTLARDTVLAALMIVLNGLTGLCLLVGGLRYREQSFRVTGASAYLAVLMVLATLTLVLPNFTEAAPGPVFSVSQLAFIGAITFALYAAFLYIQTVRHRDFFTVLGEEPEPADLHAPTGGLLPSILLLLLSLGAVVLLSKKFAAVAEVAREAVGAPPPVTGLLVALLVLLPEGIAAVRAARANELQKAINLSLGSALATIGMTVPAVAVVALAIGKPLVLGIGGSATVLLTLTLLVATLTFGTGRSNILYGFIHLVVFVTFLFLTFQP